MKILKIKIYIELETYNSWPINILWNKLKSLKIYLIANSTSQ